MKIGDSADWDVDRIYHAEFGRGVNSGVDSGYGTVVVYGDAKWIE